eukprot:scaffold535582_cov55-Attheya_sp.AAC.1
MNRKYREGDIKEQCGGQATILKKSRIQKVAASSREKINSDSFVHYAASLRLVSRAVEPTGTY